MDKKGFRLPTEAEWEYAARFQNDSTNAEQYGSVWLTKLNSASGAKNYWKNADETKAVAWYENNSGGNTHPAGGKRANALGLYDMSGNVEEWCFDQYGFDTIVPGEVTDPTGDTSNPRKERILRGGNWNSSASYCVVGLRNAFDPFASYNTVGFRAVCRP